MDQLEPNRSYSRMILDAIPLPVLVVDADMAILDTNEAGAKLLGVDETQFLRRRGGEVLHCIHSTDSPKGCGRGEHCQECVIRNSVTASIHGQRLVRQKTSMVLATSTSWREVEMLVTTSPFEPSQQRLALVILEDITELAQLRSLLPICAKCKKIRDDQQYWHKLEHYISQHLPVDFTHGLCPDCLKDYMPSNPAPPAPPGHPIPPA